MKKIVVSGASGSQPPARAPAPVSDVEKSLLVGADDDSVLVTSLACSRRLRSRHARQSHPLVPVHTRGPFADDGVQMAATSVVVRGS